MTSASGKCDRPGLVRDYLPLLGFLLLTCIASSIPGRALPPVLSLWSLDKVAHGLEFAVLGLLLMRPLARPAVGLHPAVQVLAASCAGSFWGALDELHQLLTPNRSSDVRDWIVDTVGTLAGALLLFVWTRVRAERRRRAAQAGALT